MKLQLTEAGLRLRVDEAELARLLDGGALHLRLSTGAVSLLELDARLAEAPAFDTGLERGSRWQVVLPRAAVREYCDTLPRRDALRLSLPSPHGAVGFDFEVDVRDSIHLRGPARRKG